MNAAVGGAFHHFDIPKPSLDPYCRVTPMMRKGWHLSPTLMRFSRIGRVLTDVAWRGCGDLTSEVGY